MEWHIPSEAIQEWQNYQGKLETKIAESNKVFGLLNCYAALNKSGRRISVDLEVPTSERTTDSLGTSSMKISLFDKISFAINDVALTIDRQILENYPEQIGKAIQNAKEVQRCFSSASTPIQLLFFSQPPAKAGDIAVPLVQLNCNPLKVSLPLDVFNGSDEVTQNSRSPFLKALNEIDNQALIKDFRLSYRSFSDSFNTANILNALKEFAQSVSQQFPNRSLVLHCNKDKFGHIVARINFNPDELDQMSYMDSSFCAGVAIYDHHGFFRGMVESKQATKELMVYLQSFPKDMSVGELDRDVNIITFDPSFRRIYRDMSNVELIDCIRRGRVFWRSKDNGFIIGNGRAFIPNSWEIGELEFDHLDP